ncbi:Alpha/beta hydrolase family protein [Botrimarina colliarenosi]|uniref:Alpha/beta hydrolase family protein n=1 Tax=Botrimarina colliarenosi TaxID=2528001 RepID=A0A5C6AMT3_9BACT|nr:hypothetical protein [Botrimarina colliarenosi]TWU00436.1 Alpha/beta hydrolase family protein [Botrimarina colliarenosi]
MTAAIVLLFGVVGAMDNVFYAEKEVIDQFDEIVVHIDDIEYDSFRCQLHRPVRIVAGRRYPLVLWLHGANEGGKDNEQQLRWMELVFEARPPSKQDYYVLALQCPSDDTPWFLDDVNDDELVRDGVPAEMLEYAMLALDWTLSNEPIDADRVYAAGVSSGGTACWELGIRRPNQFAAILPMASSGSDWSRIAAMKSTPVWAFHSLRDKLSYEGVQRTVQRLQDLGGCAKLTLVNNADHGIKSVLHEHDCWTGAIIYYDALGWLFSQRRGAIFARSAGFRPWPWWNWVVLGGAVGLCCAAWRFENRRRAMSSHQER